MRVNSIQPSIYKSTPRVQHQTNVSSRGWKGALKGAGAGGAGLGVLAVLGLTLCPAAIVFAGMGAALGAVAGSGIEEDNKKFDEDAKKNHPSG